MRGEQSPFSFNSNTSNLILNEKTTMNKNFKTIQECEHYLDTLQHAITYNFIDESAGYKLFDEAKAQLATLKAQEEGFEIVVRAAFPMVDSYDEKCKAHLFKITEELSCIKFDLGDTPMRVLFHQDQLKQALLGISNETDEINDYLITEYFNPNAFALCNEEAED